MVAEHLCFSYGERPFLNDISLTLESGKITTILGPNGSGKSTLLNLFVRQLLPQKGKVILGNQSVLKMKEKVIAKKIAVVHQHNTAPGDLSVEDLVGYGRAPHQSFWKGRTDEDQEQIDWAMKATHISDMRDRNLSELSGGERQRTWIAMALAQKTDLLFLDEPTTYLDIAYQMEVLNLIQELNRNYGITIVMVLHDINQAIQYSDQLIILKSGEVRYVGDVEGGITEKNLHEIYGINVVIRYCPINHCKYIIPIQLRKEAG